ncbi:MAG TPA: class I SAM-dependent methyltransferase [Terracidiphilus sp.]|nr:class I SAM-dependent methyltransferase [Terracidiphilus sp.]
MSALLLKLESILAQWESEKTLLAPSSFSTRMEILDEIDRSLAESELINSNSGRDLAERTRAFSGKLNSLNEQFFTSIRQQIKTGIFPSEFQAVLQQQSLMPPRGLAYDYLDDLVAGALQFEPPSEEPRPLGPDSVFFQPTPVRHIFHLISAAAITSADTLIDLGAGLGHVPLLVSICTGATCVGVEFDPAWVASAAKCAEELNLRSVTFTTQDARETDLSTGTVFYLYTPFTGDTLSAVLASLREQAARRSIRICTFGTCTLAVSNQFWLQPVTSPRADQIAVFLPRE